MVMSSKKECDMDPEYPSIKRFNNNSTNKEPSSPSYHYFPTQRLQNNQLKSPTDLLNYSISSQSTNQLTPITPCFALKSPGYPDQQISVEKNPRLEINYLLSDQRLGQTLSSPNIQDSDSMASISNDPMMKDETARRASWPIKPQAPSHMSSIRSQCLKRPLIEGSEAQKSIDYPIQVIKQLHITIDKLMNSLQVKSIPSTCPQIQSSCHISQTCKYCTEINITQTRELWKHINHDRIENYSLVVAFFTVCKIWCEARMVIQMNSNEIINRIMDDYRVIQLNGNKVDYLVYEGWDWFYNKIKHDESIFDIHHEDILKNFTQLMRSNNEIFEMTWIDQLYTQLFHQTNSAHKFFEGESQIQRDRGQFFTPIEVVGFMWNTAIPNWDDYIQTDLTDPQIADLVFDPCMGLGTSVLFYVDQIIKRLKSSEYQHLWNSPQVLESIYKKLRTGIFGIELDLVPFLVCQCRIECHLFPIYLQLYRLKHNSYNILNPPVKLFWNDTLQLLPREEFIKRPTHSIYHQWVHDQINQLRAFKFSFSIVLTNPPYLLRHQFSFPDPKIYSQAILGGKGHQAYLYFIWLGLHCISHDRGQLVMITPSQWLTCEFAQRFRDWMWGRILMHRLFLFDPFKVFRKVQTNSLIFSLSWRHQENSQKDHQIGFFKCKDKKLALKSMLEHYHHWNEQLNHNDNLDEVIDPNSNCPIQLKLTTQLETKLTESPSNPFYSLIPHNNLSHLMHQLSLNLPKLCDSNGKTSEWDSKSPLIWNRGPNTNPVYGLVVRTEWAKHTFGEALYSMYMIPCFYWNGCSNNPLREDGATGEGTKEIQFWNKRDPMRLNRKESSPAESYLVHNQYFKHYSLIMVDKLVAKNIIEDYHQIQSISQNPSLDRFYQFLKQVREELQPQYPDREIAFSNIQKCGNNVAQKIITPINYGYFTSTQPRQRFFLEENGTCVTNQCIYFTMKTGDQYDQPLLDVDYYLALLNSAIIQYYMNVHCQYDQQGRLRLFRSNMAHIPFQYPDPTPYQQVIQSTQLIRSLKSLVYELQSVFNPSISGPSFLLEPLRRGLVDLSETSRWQLIEDGWREISKRNPTQRFDWFQNRLKFIYRMVNFIQMKLDLIMFDIYQLPLEFVEELFEELDLMPQYEYYLEEVDKFNKDQLSGTWIDQIEEVIMEFRIWMQKF